MHAREASYQNQGLCEADRAANHGEHRQQRHVLLQRRTRNHRDARESEQGSHNRRGTQALLPPEHGEQERDQWHQCQQDLAKSGMDRWKTREDPFLILRWRGRDRAALLSRLRELRDGESGDQPESISTGPPGDRRCTCARWSKGQPTCRGPRPLLAPTASLTSTARPAQSIPQRGVNGVLDRGIGEGEAVTGQPLRNDIHVSRDLLR
ncbi:MAG: hypothetical protein K0S14_3293 [Thermomicrobiales bacterium]|nr:hypothetical protein [Thermomicrobiales bacterium]